MQQVLYPTLDANIVNKINSTIDNSNSLQFYFKRPSEHVGLGSSSITNLRTSRENTTAHTNNAHLMSNNSANVSQVLNNFNHPNQINNFNVNTQFNNTTCVVN